ncbi:hypothetical protein SORBI_3001G133200 [Sorghum bicolor]|uniref:F-box associated domain-containing protein n=1 Tax=Sorghum bicolor TaxID=4558 RepID=A0A1Z5S5I9_SORBI|nr:hypothetical protein SORBI_3001G133200 [Sorghum bicolor]
MARKIAGNLRSYLRMDKDHHGLSLASISDCCNGLVLLDDDLVVNPATRQWMRLPPYPTLPGEEKNYYDYWYLVFDPTLSPHFEVFSMKSPLDYKDKSPQLEYMLLRIYSSSTQRWEERPFLRDEEEHTTTTAANVWSKLNCGSWHAVYGHGALYAYWKLTFITRINVSSNKYQVINLPPHINSTRYHQFRLGKSVNGVHFAVAGYKEGLQVWFLDESGSKTKWVLKHVSRYPFNNDQTDKPWSLQQENNKEPTTAEKDSDWDSDADNAGDIDFERDEKYSCPYFEVLGFHPYRDIVFFRLVREVVAYYFNSSKMQPLGQLLIRYQYQVIVESFIYTPTWIGELPGANYLVS